MNAPFNLHRWIEDNRDLLKPPVGNKMIWNGKLMVMIVGGPNARTDFHINPGEELFYQIEGDIVLRTKQGSEIIDIPIRQGEMFLLPAKIPHSPQRPANTAGLVIEHQRPDDADDHMVWYCEKCGELMHDAQFHLEDLGRQLKPILEEVKENKDLRTCKKCGHVHA